MPHLKKLLFILTTICCLSPAIGQKKQTFIKASASLFKNGIGKSPRFSSNEIDRSPISLFSAGILFINFKKNKYQEFAVTNFSFDNEKMRSTEIRQYTFGARYEYGKLGKQFNDKISIRYGGFLEFFSGKNEFTPSTTQRFPVDQSSTGINLAFSPHLDIALSKRLFIDFNPAVVLISYFFKKTHARDPTLPQRQQEQSSMNLNAGGLNVMLGVGYKF